MPEISGLLPCNTGKIFLGKPVKQKRKMTKIEKEQVRKVLARDQMSEFIIRWREAFPDLRMEIEELLIENDLAATRLTFSGTHMAPWAGAEPSGEHVSMAPMMFFRFEDGKMVELWEVDDQLGFRRQLGLIP
jgi:predicted ester cyclase